MVSDKYGHHALCCIHNANNRYFRHNIVRNVIAAWGRKAMMAVKLECPLPTQDPSSARRPADVVITHGSFKALVDTTVMSPFPTDATRGDPLDAVVKRKTRSTIRVRAHDGTRTVNIVQAADAVGMTYRPVAISALARWHPKATEFVDDLTNALHYQFPEAAHDVHDKVGDFRREVRNAVNKAALETLPLFLMATGQIATRESRPTRRSVARVLRPTMTGATRPSRR